MWNVVSNTNDPVGGDCGCGNRSLYQIQMMLLVATMDVERGLLYQIQTIVVVMNIEEELDRCIKYKRSCEGEDEEKTMVVVRRKERSVDIFLYLLSFNEVTCCHHVTHATMQTHAT